MHDRDLVAFVCRDHDSLHGCVVEHVDGLVFPRPGAAIVVDDLDIVRAFGNARVHERLRFYSPADGRNWRPAHLCRMTASDCDSGSRGEDR